MKRRSVFVAALISFGVTSAAFAAPKDDVAAATQAWVDGMNAHDAKQVVSLYAPDAVLWGTRSPTLRDKPAEIADYFKLLDKVPPSYKVVVDEQDIRVYGDVAIDTGRYTFSEVRDGKPLIRPSRFSLVFVNRNGEWMIVDHHSSAVPAAVH